MGPEPANQVVIPVRVQLTEPLLVEYARGTAVPVRLRWEAFSRLDGYYSASVRLIDAEGQKALNVDHEPRGRTFLWKPDERMDDEFDLNLPEDLAAGQYLVQLMMYQAETGTNVLLLDENFWPRETLTLGEFQVK